MSEGRVNMRSVYLFIHKFMTTYTYKFINVPMDWTEAVPPVGETIHIHLYTYSDVNIKDISSANTCIHISSTSNLHEYEH